MSDPGAQWRHILSTRARGERGGGCVVGSSAGTVGARRGSSFVTWTVPRCAFIVEIEVPFAGASVGSWQ